MIKEGTAIRDLYPDYVEAGNVYEFLARGYLAKGDKAEGDGGAGALLRDRRARSRTRSSSSRRLQIEAGTEAEAAATLERLNLIYLETTKPHTEARRSVHGSGQSDRRDSRISGACWRRKPIDPAGAHYRAGAGVSGGQPTG